MRVLVAGASGVIGRPLLRVLRAAGHEVIGLARRGRAGATTVLAVDALDPDAVTAAVGDGTVISSSSGPRRS